jgi:hypothetical protein
MEKKHRKEVENLTYPIKNIGDGWRGQLYETYIVYMFTVSYEEKCRATLIRPDHVVGFVSEDLTNLFPYTLFTREYRTLS